jgi:protein tyrosine/serine phosphatase
MSEQTVSWPQLDGVVNFRDFGGAKTLDGRRVREGVLFRSGHHTAVTEADLEKLAGLDLGLIVDLRRPAERKRDPAVRPPDCRAEIIEHNGPADAAMAPHLAFLAEPDASPARVTAQMIVGYQGYPFDPHYVEVFSRYFAMLADARGAVLIHCHAGKDRTGVLCALTQHVLGVGREGIFEDYIATNRYNRADARLVDMAAVFQRTHGKPVSDELLIHVMAADAAYLEAAFAAIEAAHGDVDAYLAEVLDVTPARRDAIRARYVA